MVRKALSSVLRPSNQRVFVSMAVWTLIIITHPAAASAANACADGNTGPFHALGTSISDFKTTLTYVSSALVVVGLVASAIGWMMRSHEGLGPVFWGGITMVGAGSLVLLGDNFVQAVCQSQ